MKKRTLAEVALVCFLATLAGCLPAAIALAAPTPPPIQTPSPASLPTVTEQTALVIEPGQVRQLSLRLNAGDRVEGHVTVAPADISFIIQDPYEKTVLNAGRVTDTAFTLVAASRGIYQLVFGNSLFLVANKVVLVQIQHTGPPLFPYLAGTYVLVNAGEVKTITVELPAKQAVAGTLKIEGGQQDLGFSISDPSGSTVFSPGKVYGSYTFTLTASTAGVFQLSFDNSASAYMSKLALIDIRNSSGGLPLSWGTATRLVFTTSPDATPAGSAFASQPVVTVQDNNGNTATGSSAVITVAITAGTGATGATLSGTTAVTALYGVASFSGLSINLAASGYTLTATSTGLVSGASSPFDVERLLPPNCVGLEVGWNLISLPLVPSNPAITAVLADILSSVTSVWRYDIPSASWLNYVPALGGTLTTMTDGSAYWVNMNAPAILAVDSTELSTSRTVRPTYPVAAGWNPIGFKSTSPRNAAEYLTGTSYRIFPMYGFTSGAFSTINPSADSLQPGLGYWVYFNEAGNIRP